ncbi:hypothetical protein I4990_18180 [Providencia alcalifaciens]|nr:hypothetical protein [Providencia alcalifaciens]
MDFKCKECGEKISGSKMIGLIAGKIGKAKLEQSGVNSFSKQDFLSGFLTGFKISCPKCGKCNWE